MQLRCGQAGKPLCREQVAGPQRRRWTWLAAARLSSVVSLSSRHSPSVLDCNPRCVVSPAGLVAPGRAACSAGAVLLSDCGVCAVQRRGRRSCEGGRCVLARRRSCGGGRCVLARQRAGHAGPGLCLLQIFTVGGDSESSLLHWAFRGPSEWPCG